MLHSENRPWGVREEWINEPGYRVQRIIIHPGKRFSLQYHKHRDEHWVIAQGVGKLTISNQQKNVSIGDHIFVPQECIHRLENTGQEDLIFIETQLGKCREEDIVRIEDDWNRK